MKLKKIVIIFLTMALICGFSLSVSFAEDPAFSYALTDGETSNNAHYPRPGGHYGCPTRSHLIWDGDDLVRVEYWGGRIIAETYDSSFNVKNLTEIEAESIYGGFYSGSDAYYLAFGFSNPDESDDVEVFRFVKYDKNWNRIEACPVYGANTIEPFGAGGLAMAEHDGVLYIHTCHRMYKSPNDGLNHQANCTFKVQESDMTLISSCYGVYNLSGGYVSHSFQQRVAVDDDYLYRADLGDAYPRAISLTATSHKYEIDDASMYHCLVDIPGETGDNETGFTLGGVGLSSDCVVVAGCGVTEEGGPRNIFTSSVQKMEWDDMDGEDVSETTNWLTDYGYGSRIELGTPKLIKLNSDKFLLMWEEWRKYGDYQATKAVLLSHDGTPESDIYAFPIPLSDCEPAVDGDGNVIWYYTLNSSPKFFVLDPLRLAEAEQQIARLHSLDLCEVSIGSGPFTYDGSEFRPDIKVVCLGDTLTAGKDYTLIFANNINAGQASVTIRGAGAYSGEVTEYFTIEKAYHNILYDEPLRSIKPGATFDLNAGTEDNAKITYRSEDPGIVTVDENGKVTAVGEGQTHINIVAAETDNYRETSDEALFTVSKDSQMNEEPDDPWDWPDDDYDDVPEDGTVFEVNGSTYTVLDGWDQTVALTKAKNRKSFTVPSAITIEDYGAFTVDQIDARAFTGKSIRTVTIGINVRKISKYAFKSSKATKMIVKTKLLSKARVKGCLKSSKIKTVQVKVSTKKSTNKKYLKKYKKYFTKANAGKKVSVR